MPLTPYMAKNVLDWILGGAAAVQPGSRWIMWATASPRTDSAFDGPYNSRRSYSCAAAASPQGSQSNRAAQTATITASATAVGWNLYDRSSGGTRLMFGTWSANIGGTSGDLIAFAAGALKVTIT